MVLEFRFSFPLPQGLHARPASVIQEAAARFDAEIFWDNLRTGSTADAKSILSLIGTDTQHDDPCRIRLSGGGADEALRTLKQVIESELLNKEQEAEESQAVPAGTAAIPRLLILEKAIYYQGVPAGRGIVRGRVAIHDPALEPGGEDSTTGRGPAEERDDFFAAAEALEADMLLRRDATREKTERAVIDAHLAILHDPAFASKVEGVIAAGGASAVDAVSQASRHFCDLLQAGRSQYLRERMADIRDVSRHLIARLRGTSPAEWRIDLRQPSILVADDLSPSQFLAMNKSNLLGLGLESGGVTSHALIMCRARGIPALTGCPGLREKLRAGEDVILDGTRGLVIPAPSAAVNRYYDREMDADEKRTAVRRRNAGLAGRTADGRAIEIAANIVHPDELQAAWREGAEGVGLFRTEGLLMDRGAAPDEEEQYALYARLAAESDGRSIIIRTFDIGGDKPISYLPIAAEANPFLGCRGLRLYDRFADLVRAQLRAILRAAAKGSLKIMFPMVSTVEEIVAMRELMRRITEELAASSIPHRPDTPVGMMVEVPSAALQIDKFSEHVDFFSVGSNDLLQYLFAVDRGNPGVAGLGGPHHPAFLRMLKTIVEAAHARSRWVGLCGEAAASPRMLPLLVGLGFDELSMSAAAIPEIKARLRGLDSIACRDLAAAAAALPLARDVDALLDSFERRGKAEELITTELVKIGSASRSKADVLQELAIMMEAAGRVAWRADFEEALWRREDTFSTGIGFGVAIPHGQSAAVRSSSIGVLRLAHPFPWDAAADEPVKGRAFAAEVDPRAKPALIRFAIEDCKAGAPAAVDLVLMLGLPAAESNRDHLKLLARLSRRLVDEEFRAKLRAAADEAAVVEIVSGALAGGS